MIIRAAKCRFARLNKRYHNGKFREVQEEDIKRGVLTGLDRSHNKDNKVGPASDPLLVVHGKVEDNHEDLKASLKRMDLWMEEFRPIEIPRTGRNGEASYAPAFKALPRSASRIKRYIEVIEDEAEGFAFTSDNDVEAMIPDVQQSLADYSASQPEEEPSNQEAQA